MAGSKNPQYPDIENVAYYVTRLFEAASARNFFLVYHNIAHTHAVVARAREIAASYQLTQHEINIIESAAWFHDCGHLDGPCADHEKRSVSMMKIFMRLHSVSEHIIERIEKCILATKLPSAPEDLAGQILCDADLFHLGTLEFFVMDLLLKREYELRQGTAIPNWDENSLNLLRTHQYYTSYCRSLLDAGKETNIALQIQKMGQNRSARNA